VSDGRPEIRRIPVEQLRLDPENPRLPEDLQGAEQPELLRYLWDNGVLNELIESFADNGFFEHEPLIGTAHDDTVVILEGNRRLASLMVLLGLEAARDQDLEPRLEQPLARPRRAELAQVPVYVVADREEVHKYLGFRHIGGIKTWSAEAKARYLVLETDKAADAGAGNPFFEVGRRVGSNSLGIRNAYTALTVLRHARAEFGIDVNDIVDRRFGVWTRCMTASDVRRYIGLNSARSYDEVKHDISRLPEPPLREVVEDLSSRGGTPPLVRDSRQVTVYGQILQDEHAREVLRAQRNFEIARQIVEMAELPVRIDDLRARVLLARDEAERATWSSELLEAADLLFRAARSLKRAVEDLAEE
jgi:hypothetical protein